MTGSRLQSFGMVKFSFRMAWSLRPGWLVVLAAVALLIDDPWAGRPATRAEEPWLIGQVLVAKPGMVDPRFAKTVIYMCRHSEEGAFGLVINRGIAALPAATIAEAFGLSLRDEASSVPVRWGGPVEIGRGFMLHSTDHMGAGSSRIETGVAMSTEPDLLEDWLNGAGPANGLLLFGYAGWAGGQLEQELARDDWATVDVDAGFLFDLAPEAMWARAMEKRGIDL